MNGIFLDRGTSLIETLAAITAEEAPIPVGGKCATTAAQVTHVSFYLGVLDRYIHTAYHLGGIRQATCTLKKEWLFPGFQV